MTICENDNLMENINKLEKEGYKYIVKANDKFLSGWGHSSGCKHIQLIACKTPAEMVAIMRDLENDNSFNYINHYTIEHEKQGIYNATRGKTYTIRNDWTRCF